MGERIKITAKKPLSTKENSASNKQKTGFRSQSSHVDQILFLQRTIGNQAVQRLIKSGALQAKLKIGQPGDVYEQEADRVADEVMRMPSNTGNREQDTGNSTIAFSDHKLEADVIGGSSRSLPKHVRDYFEPRFGYDFSHVRIHNNSEATDIAESFQAKAFTVGKDIMFGTGQYNTESIEGKRLLAHELVHTMQQGNVIRRTCDPASLQNFNQRVATIRQHSAYRTLISRCRTIANRIIQIARTHNNCLYYANRLLLLFNTPNAPQTQVAQAGRQESITAASAEQTRLTSPEGQRMAGVEEAMSSDPTRHWTRRRGDGGVYYYVDARQPTNIVVRVRVRLRSQGRGTAADVARTRSLQDAIEKHASTSGYTLDLQFVNRGGRDVFTIGVDPSQFTTSHNWVGEPHSLAHELHHLLGLPDRYDYIQAHADNPHMRMCDRLYWFRVQIRLPPDPQGSSSLMGGGRNLLDDDICRVAGLNLATCTSARITRRQEIETARSGAFIKTFDVYSKLSGIRPAGPYQRPGYPTTNQLAQQHAQSIARAVFRRRVPLRQLRNTVTAMRNRLTNSLRIEVTPSTDSRCSNQPSYVAEMRPPFLRICPRFFQQSSSQRIDNMVRDSARLTGIGSQTTTSLCPAYDCQTSCGGTNNADAWSHYVDCINRQVR